MPWVATSGQKYKPPPAGFGVLLGSLLSGPGLGVKVLVGTGVLEGGTWVAVLVAVGGTGVLEGGTWVAVLVAVGGTGVKVLVGGTAVFVGGTGVLVAGGLVGTGVLVAGGGGGSVGSGGAGLHPPWFSFSTLQGQLLSF
ncbi:MAG: hypothetical protein UY56_C0006G0001 [Parcubacteria group bacterium GW2011_GWA1_50_14]|nr:MAG: hypothetical protein UY56_C0006G0001 [Parcubacteria group bacterium GW2011_GWA1_50_14]